MHIDFWKRRWHDNQIGFHLSEVNPYLINHWSRLNSIKNSKVLVPMCGKSLDMVWLASEKYSVLGIECSEKAINEFFTEQQLDVKSSQHKSFVTYQSNNFNIMHGDFFKLDQQDLAEVSAVYDRASLVALPEDMRERYIDLLTSSLPERVDILLVTIEYNQSLMSGPPFSVSNEEVARLYKPAFSVELITQCDVLNDSPGFKQKGLDEMIERVYKISR